VAVGKAAYYGSAFGKHLVAPIIDLVPTPDRKGYWLIGATAACTRSGCGERGRCRRQAAAGPGRGRRNDSGRRGGTGWSPLPRHHGLRRRQELRLDQVTDHGHVVAIVATTDGKGYWIAFRTGRVFNFGDARNYGSARPGNVRQLIVAMAAMPTGAGTGSPKQTGTCSALATRCTWRRSIRRESRRPSWVSPSPPTARETGWPNRTVPS